MRTRTHRLLPSGPQGRYRSAEGLRGGAEGAQEDPALQMLEGREGGLHLGDY